MQYLEYTHNNWLVVASLLVALMAGFTGLSLTQGLSERSIPQRKVLIALASVALGGGIWSMHFVAMLGLQLPILFYYDAAITLASALVAILVVGVALLILHFYKRTRQSIVLAGVIVGLGVLTMHYIGMAGLELCKALYTPIGIASAILASCGLNIATFYIAYGNRTHRNILLGTLFFGFAVFSVHFVAIGGTNFISIDAASEVGPLIGNEVMAIGVVVSSFILSGAFLLTGITFLAPAPSDAAPEETASGDSAGPAVAVDPAAKAPPRSVQIPYQQEGRTLFMEAGGIVAIRAEGHYTALYTPTGRLFCPWSITEAEKRLSGDTFVRTHRSFLLNPDHVTRFERLKDNGLCHVDATNLEHVPVSRSRLSTVREVLGV